MGPRRAGAAEEKRAKPPPRAPPPPPAAARAGAVAADDAGIDPEEAEMMALMGFGGFSSTQGKQVDDQLQRQRGAQEDDAAREGST